MYVFISYKDITLLRPNFTNFGSTVSCWICDSPTPFPACLKSILYVFLCLGWPNFFSRNFSNLPYFFSTFWTFESNFFFFFKKIFFRKNFFQKNSVRNFLFGKLKKKKLSLNFCRKFFLKNYYRKFFSKLFFGNFFESFFSEIFSKIV